MSWAARWTSAVTAWWTWAGVRVPSRYFDRAWNWMRHRPSRAAAAICGRHALHLRAHRLHRHRRVLHGEVAGTRPQEDAQRRPARRAGRPRRQRRAPARQHSQAQVPGMTGQVAQHASPAVRRTLMRPRQRRVPGRCRGACRRARRPGAGHHRVPRAALRRSRPGPDRVEPGDGDEPLDRRGSAVVVGGVEKHRPARSPVRAVGESVGDERAERLDVVGAGGSIAATSEPWDWPSGRVRKGAPSAVKPIGFDGSARTLPSSRPAYSARSCFSVSNHTANTTTSAASIASWTVPRSPGVPARPRARPRSTPPARPV